MPLSKFSETFIIFFREIPRVLIEILFFLLAGQIIQTYDKRCRGADITNVNRANGLLYIYMQIE